ncbi:hypothetical protein PATA110616_00350 [Paenibacillus tarimensis]
MILHTNGRLEGTPEELSEYKWHRVENSHGKD